MGGAHLLAGDASRHPLGGRLQRRVRAGQATVGLDQEDPAEQLASCPHVGGPESGFGQLGLARPPRERPQADAAVGVDEDVAGVDCPVPAAGGMQSGELVEHGQTHRDHAGRMPAHLPPQRRETNAMGEALDLDAAVVEYVRCVAPPISRKTRPAAGQGTYCNRWAVWPSTPRSGVLKRFFER